MHRNALELIEQVKNALLEKGFRINGPAGYGVYGFELQRGEEIIIMFTNEPQEVVLWLFDTEIVLIYPDKLIFVDLEDNKHREITLEELVEEVIKTGRLASYP